MYFKNPFQHPEPVRYNTNVVLFLSIEQHLNSQRVNLVEWKLERGFIFLNSLFFRDKKYEFHCTINKGVTETLTQAQSGPTKHVICFQLFEFFFDRV